MQRHGRRPQSLVGLENSRGSARREHKEGIGRGRGGSTAAGLAGPGHGTAHVTAGAAADVWNHMETLGRRGSRDGGFEVLSPHTRPGPSSSGLAFTSERNIHPGSLTVIWG